jgi:hypothetical protein
VFAVSVCRLGRSQRFERRIAPKFLAFEIESYVNKSLKSSALGPLYSAPWKPNERDTMAIELQERFQPNRADIAAKIIEGEVIILNIANGLYFSMGEVGAFVWEQIEVGCSSGELRDAVAACYDVDTARAGEDVSALLQALLEEGLVLRTEVHGAPTTHTIAASRLPYVRPELHRYDDMVDLLALDPPMPGLGNRTWRDPGD